MLGRLVFAFNESLHIAEFEVKRPYRKEYFSEGDGERGHHQDEAAGEDELTEQRLVGKEDKKAEHAAEEAGDTASLHAFDEVDAAAEGFDLSFDVVFGGFLVLGVEGPDAPSNGIEAVGVGHEEQGYGGE